MQDDYEINAFVVSRGVPGNFAYEAHVVLNDFEFVLSNTTMKPMLFLLTLSKTIVKPMFSLDPK